MKKQALLIAFALAGLLVALLYARWRVYDGFVIPPDARPRITEQYDSQRRRYVKKGHFEVALYSLSPALWRAWEYLLILLLVAGMLAAIGWVLRTGFSAE